MNTTMNARDTVSAKLASCYVTVDGNRYLLMQAKNLEAKVEKTKNAVSILGKTGEGNKSAGWSGSGSMTIYKNTSIFDEMMEKYKETGEDVYFEIQITNEDPTSAAGRAVTVLKGCNIDGGQLSGFDAEGEWLEQDVDFTFEDFQLKEKFNELSGMR